MENSLILSIVIPALAVNIFADLVKRFIKLYITPPVFIMPVTVLIISALIIIVGTFWSNPPINPYINALAVSGLAIIIYDSGGYALIKSYTINLIKKLIGDIK